MVEAQSEALEQPNGSNDVEEWDEDDYDDEEDEDIDAEAEEIARRLGAELWADISKANADRSGDPPPLPIAQTVAPSVDLGNAATASSISSLSRKGEAAIITMRAILTFVENDPLARTTLASAVIPNSNGDSVLDTMNRIITSGTVPKNIAMPLSHILVSLARSEVLFGALRHSNASSIQLDKGKRKREGADEGPRENDPRAYKRQHVQDSDLQTQVTEAVRVITHAFGTSLTHSLDPSLISSIRLQLYQIFLFAVTSSAGGGRDMHALQEIGGLIQVIGVLSGIQIGQNPAAHPQRPQHPHAYPPSSTYPWLSGQTSLMPTDIGTAVYPCLVAGCRKTFSRLYSLRAHQRVHAVHRPFRCHACPASFARNHDLKRHVKLHDKKGWKCGGCNKAFSRRDAIKRHQDGSKSRGPKSEACLEAEVVEVELDEEGEESMREERRAKIWNGIASSQASGLPPHHGHRGDPHMEEGELVPAVISGTQLAVMSLHGLLQAHVGNALGSPMGQPIAPPVDPTGGQATLASVIARAQLQNQPPQLSASNQPDIALDPSLSTSSSSTQPEQVRVDVAIASPPDIAPGTVPSLSMYGLSDEQTKLLEEAIANAASAAQAQAEAEAALEEEEEVYEQDDDDGDGSEGHTDLARSL